MSLSRSAFPVMGTMVSFATPEAGIGEMMAVVQPILREADERFSPYRPSSELSRLQREPAPGPEMSDQMRQVLTECLDLQERTAGFFRPHDRRGRVDTTGYVKGWAMRQAELALRERGWANWSLSVGGDVVVAGHNGDRPWHVAVRHPARAGRVAEILALTDAAAATSGDYERGHHIWGRHDRVRGGSVTVTGPRVEIADALATALWAHGDAVPGWVADFPDYGVLRLDAGGARLAA